AGGLATGRVFVEDVVDTVGVVDGFLPVCSVKPEPARLHGLAAPASRRAWWINRIKDCYGLLP
ncbi:MAG: O-succinylbenzoate synthase, partial [Mycobacteriaceae bacterium]|nr:O-succinylbenzoate synthase [Mycobacteriaceae bacterium]